MNTVYWLSILLMAVGYGYFLRQVFWRYMLKRTFDRQPAVVQLGVIMHGGVWANLPYWHLVYAAAATIVFFTV